MRVQPALQTAHAGEALLVGSPHVVAANGGQERETSGAGGADGDQEFLCQASCGGGGGEGVVL